MPFVGRVCACSCTLSFVAAATAPDGLASPLLPPCTHLTGSYRTAPLAGRRPGERPGDDLPDTCKLYVGNLSPAVDESLLRQMFEPFGTVLHSAVITDIISGTWGVWFFGGIWFFKVHSSMFWIPLAQCCAV